MQELVRSSLDGRISASEAGDVIKAMVDKKPEGQTIDYHEMLIDTISLLEESDHRRSVLLPLFHACGVKAESLREVLELEALVGLNLVRGNFVTQRNRKATNLLYRQSNYNLLREETEGYAKLITEYFNIATTPIGAMNDDFAEDAFQRVKALVGSFDLDVGRVLDITLDVFANLLIKHFRFFIKYLRASSWWPEDHTLDNVKWECHQFDQLPKWALPGSATFFSSLEERERITNLRQTRDVEFWGRVKEIADEQMEEVKQKLVKEKEERERASRPGGAARNALAMAGALADDMPAPPPARSFKDTASSKASTPKPEDKDAKTEEDEKDKLPEPADQKIALLKSLLAIGALPEALYILGRFPWLVELAPEVPEHIHRILHHMLSKVYEETRPLSDREGLEDAANQVGDPAGLPKGSLNLTSAPPRKTLRWAKLDRADLGDGTAFMFYWDEWADNIPVCQTVDDVFLLCDTFLNLSGVNIGRDASLLSKLIRIGKHSMSQDSSEANGNRWIALTKRLLVPALSLTSQNPGVVNEAFELLKNWPTSVRYSIYAYWYTTASRVPEIQSAFKAKEAEAKDTLKRISKENIRPMGKKLAKVAYNLPGVVMRTAIQQMESYDNLIEVVVECTRYFTYLGYDVLTWSLMNALGNAGRNRVQADGMLTSSWLRALSNFAGAIFKRYSTTDPSPILQYVAHELRNGNSTDLEILEQIITSMAGIRSDITFNDAQVIAMAGGEVLRAQTLINLLDERHKSEKTSRRLLKALTEPGLAGQLLISIAQELQMYANHDTAKDAPLKVLGNNIDKIYQVFSQYLDLLRSNMSAKDFDAAVPDIPSLIADFGLDPSIAFTVGRVGVAAAIVEADAAKKAEQQEKRLTQDKPQVNGDSTMADAEEAATVGRNGTIEPDVDVKMETPAEGEDTKLTITEADGETKEVSIANKAATPTPSPTPAPGGPTHNQGDYWHPALSPLIEGLKGVLGPDIETSMSLPFYVAFWTLSLQDILVNSNSYEQELATLSHQIAQISNDRSDVSARGAQERDRKKKVIMDLKDRLTQEMKSQIGAYTQVRNRLNKEKDHWFPAFHTKVDNDLLNLSILQNCFLPRMLLSPLDAHYTFLMLKFLHNNGAPGFRTMHLYDLFFRKNQLAALISQCTSREAENLGRFLNELLKDLSSWHADKATYEKNAFGAKKQLPGFARRMTAENTPETFLEYEDFRRLLWKWHGNLNGAFKHCFESGEYMHIRNAIILLKSVHQHFPAVNFMGKDMQAKVTTLSQEEQRADLKLAAASLLGDLKKREKAWILPQAFRINEAPGAPKAGQSRPGTPQTGATPQPSANAAADTKTSSTPVPNGDSQANVRGGNDAEDGEIDDEKKDVDAMKTAETPLVTVDKPADSESVSRENKLDGAPSRPTTPSAPANRALETPVQPGSLPAKPDSSRPSSVQPQPGRGAHGLPIKPEPARPDSRQSARSNFSDRSGDRQGKRDGRERGQPSDYGRPERPVDTGRMPSGYPREPSPGHRSRARTPDRDYLSERERRDYAQGLPRPDDRRAHHDTRADAAWGPLRRDSGPHQPSGRHGDRGFANGMENMPPPANAGPQARGTHSREPLPPQAEVAAAVNPQRMAMINGSGARGSRDSRRERDDRSARDSRPRSASPVLDPRYASSSGPSRIDGPRDERRIPLDPSPYPPHDRRDEPSDRAPTGPRRSGASRDLFEGPAPARPPPADASHGRLGGRDMRHQDPNYGRLNAATEAPSGPRSLNGPSAQGGRDPPPSQPRGRGRPSDAPSAPPPSSPSSIRQPPSAPQSDRRNERPQPSSSAPSTPASEQAPPVGAVLHPSRMAQLAPIQTNNPPSGPKGRGGPPAGTPTGPSPVNKGPPSGPALASDRRGGGDRRFAGLNDTLQGGGIAGPGTSIRGRANRQAGDNMPASAAQPPSGPATPAPAQTQPHPTRANLIDDPEARGSSGPPSSGSYDGRSGGRNDARGERRSDRDRHRSSRDTSREGVPRDDGRDSRRGSEREHEDRSGRGPREAPRYGPREEVRRNGDRSIREDPYAPSPLGGPPMSAAPSQAHFNAPPHNDRGYGIGSRSREPLPPQQMPDEPRGPSRQFPRGVGKAVSENQTANSHTTPLCPHDSARSSAAPPSLHRQPCTPTVGIPVSVTSSGQTESQQKKSRQK
ncbi:THO2 plays a role in transcriptional elongation [Zalaria obscura]|uniref:THO2 plays a role in transcriptional elongation n=1 Tax=Zalaria obscura TaxID=2024903 RepID=A0ACC3S950_9PEZI